KRRADLLNKRPEIIADPDLLTVSEDLIDGFHAYDRPAVAAVGGLNLALDQEAEDDLALRLAQQFEIRLVPEFLYARRCERNNLTVASPLRFFGSRPQPMHRRWQLYRFKKRLLPNQRRKLFSDLGWILTGKRKPPLRVRATRLLRAGYQFFVQRLCVP